MGGGCHEIFEVWSWNFDAEFGQLLAALGSGDEVVLALDTEFPGFLREEKQNAKPTARYAALRQNCDNLRPIQLGISIADPDGTLRGTWCFNLLFDVNMDLYTEASVAFLEAAGLDFPRHATEGIEPAKIGRKLRASPLVGHNGCRHRWVTFQGSYDFGYMLRLLTNRRLPANMTYFEELQSNFFPDRYELRDELPRGSLDSLLREWSVERHGTPHTAGSDALATLELFFQVTQEGPKRFRSIAYSEASTTASFHTESGSGNYFQEVGGYGGYNNWTDDAQAHHEVGQAIQDVPAWNEAFMSNAEMSSTWEEAAFDRGNPQGQWPLLSTPGPQIQTQVPSLQAQPLQMEVTSVAIISQDPVEQQVCQLQPVEAPMQLMPGSDAVVLWAVPVPADATVVWMQPGAVEQMSSDMMYANGQANSPQVWQAVIAG